MELKLNPSLWRVVADGSEDTLGNLATDLEDLASKLEHDPQYLEDSVFKVPTIIHAIEPIYEETVQSSPNHPDAVRIREVLGRLGPYLS